MPALFCAEDGRAQTPPAWALCDACGLEQSYQTTWCAVNVIAAFSGISNTAGMEHSNLTR
jgi:hypothetical protein